MLRGRTGVPAWTQNDLLSIGGCQAEGGYTFVFSSFPDRDKAKNFYGKHSPKKLVGKEGSFWLSTVHTVGSNAAYTA